MTRADLDAMMRVSSPLELDAEIFASSRELFRRHFALARAHLRLAQSYRVLAHEALGTAEDAARRLGPQLEMTDEFDRETPKILEVLDARDEQGAG